MKKGELNDITAKGCKSLIRAACKQQWGKVIRHDEITVYEVSVKQMDAD